MRRLLASFLAASIALSSFPALASEADAKDFFTRGRELRAKGDCKGAVPLFRKAWELYPQGLGSLRNLAECEEQLGHYASSRRSWLDLKRALLVTKDSKYEGWESDAEAAAKRLAPKVAQMTLVVTQVGGDGVEGPLTDPNVKITVNGDVLDKKLLDVALDRDPGNYKVRIEGGKEPVETDVYLAAGDTKSVKLKVELPQSEKDKPPPPPPEGGKKITTPETPPPSGGGAGKTVGYIVVGVGAASAIGAGVFFAMRQGALSDLEAACPGGYDGTCRTGNPAAARDAVDRGKSAAMLTNIFAGVAVVGLGVGIVLIATSGSSEKEPAKGSVKLSPWASAGGGGAFLTGEF